MTTDRRGFFLAEIFDIVVMFSQRLQNRLPALAALAALIVIAFALVRGRFKLGMVLFHVAVAAGQKWSEARARRRLGDALAAQPLSIRNDAA